MPTVRFVVVRLLHHFWSNGEGAAVFSLAWFAGDPALAEGEIAEPDSTEATIRRLTRERAPFQRGLATLQAVASEHAKAGNTEEAGQAMLHAAELKKKVDECT